MVYQSRIIMVYLAAISLMVVVRCKEHREQVLKAKNHMPGEIGRASQANCSRNRFLSSQRARTGAICARVG
jgi:hypothetical protein